jgi:hypothetical protein
MKKKVVFSALLVLLVTICSRANEIGKTYMFERPTQLVKCDIAGNNPGTSLWHSSGILFKIDGIATTGQFIIHILPLWSDIAFTQTNYLTTYATVWDRKGMTPQPDIFFLLPVADFNNNVQQRIKGDFTVGLVNLPIKMRFGSRKLVDDQYTRDFLLSNDVSLGLSFGIKLSKPRAKWSASIVTGFALCSVQVDSSTTKGLIKSAQNASGVTIPLGFFIEHNDFQIGAFSGFDFLTGPVGRKWLYADKPWLGIAIGYSLFKFGDGTKTQD